MGSLMTSSSSAGPIQISKFPEPCLALWMEPMLTFCALEHQIVVGSCGPVYKDFFFSRFWLAWKLSESTAVNIRIPTAF